MLVISKTNNWQFTARKKQELRSNLWIDAALVYDMSGRRVLLRNGLFCSPLEDFTFVFLLHKHGISKAQPRAARGTRVHERLVEHGGAAGEVALCHCGIKSTL